ncbi:iron-containing redox enzyme family protein [Shewanella surugensis]|uniref:Iron-containing redox enzyme family protein n=1 Tax=Shewanella surugensis TaxID=212020 RepID=A0ABT0LGQ1_9GAMM|nr:iron-containing redox enzyme family protein [Shewanella surugensis]MCL1126874.1 iron-containing redox enzyme family protein [Shewanella surugensis]
MSFINELAEICDKEWGKIKAGTFFRLANEAITTELYIDAMVQVFHYTKNNAINQAAATFPEDHKKVGLLRFAMRHALEELGHENMVVRDLGSMGVDLSVFDTPPLPATEALNGYLHSVAIRGGVIPRLGYSFWAEDSYEHLGGLLDACRNVLKLTDKQLSFFVAHAVIDIKHAQDVNDAIEEWVVTDKEKRDVIQVAKTTLFLTGQILESVAQTYLEKQENLALTA